MSTMAPTTVRAGSSSGLMWLGAVGVFIGVMTVLSAVGMLVQDGPLAAVITVLVGLVIIVAGTGLFLLARRACARVDEHGVSWSTMLGERGAVPWERVHQVIVPAMHEPGGAVLLWLRDGSLVEIPSLRKTQTVQGTAAHPWYLRAGNTVVRAHQQYLHAKATWGIGR